MCKPLCAARSSQSSLARAVRLADASRSADEGNHKKQFSKCNGEDGTTSILGAEEKCMFS